MKNQTKYLLVRIVTGFFLLLLYYNVEAQVQTARYNTSMTPLSNGFYEYLPQGYNTNLSQKYPLLIHVHGLGGLGDGSPAQLIRCVEAGAPLQIMQGIFPPVFTSGAEQFSFLVITPQFTQWPDALQLGNIIDYAIAHYRVDINRIYLTGLSMGGGVVWEYAGDYALNSNRIAAIVPVAGASWPWIVRMENMANADLAVWATHNDSDNVVPTSATVDWVNGINGTINPPTPLAKMSIFHTPGHDAWTHTYDLNFKEDGVNIYEWMLKYKRNFVPLPVTGLEFNAVKKDNNRILLQWKTISEINSRGFEVQRSRDGTGFNPIGFVNSTAVNGNGADYSFTDITPLDGRNYYRLKQVDINNNITYSATRFVDLNRGQSVTVYPNPVADVLNINSTGYTFNHAQLRVMDINGRVVREQTISSNHITVTVKGLAPGTYMGEIREGTETVRFRFVKQ